MNCTQQKKHRVSPTCEAPRTRDTAPARDMPAACAELLAEKNGKSQSAATKDAVKAVTGGTAISSNNTRADDKPSESRNTAFMNDNDKRNGAMLQKVVFVNDDSAFEANMRNATAEVKAKATTTAQRHCKTVLPITDLPKENVAVTLKTRVEILQDSLTTKSSKSVHVAKDDNVKASSSFPSPPPSNDNSPISKRPISDVEAEAVEHARKKQCLIDARLPTQNKTHNKLQLMNNKLRTFSKKFAHAAAPVVANPDCVLTYADYDDNSIPILHSALIQRYNSPVLLNNPSVELKAKAHILLESPCGFIAEDLGRPPKISKIGSTKIINDVDLYVMANGKIYVATERGLLLAADYLKLAGIPESTGVRFKGLKPAWIRESVAKRFTKKVCTTTEDPDAPEQENSWPPILEGDLGLIKGAPVQVYEQHPNNGRAFGRRIDNQKLGWFDLKNLTDLNAPCPEWEGLWTSDIMQMVYADPEYDLPLSAKSVSPPKSAAQLSATLPVQPTEDPVAAKSANAKAKRQSLEVPKTKSASTITDSVIKAADAKSESGATHKTQDIKAETYPPTVGAEAAVQPASRANRDGKKADVKLGDAPVVQASGANNNDVKVSTKQDDTTAVPLNPVSKGGSDTRAKPEDGDFCKATEPKIVEAFKHRKQLPLEPRALISVP
jgi:hypothetical protein